MKKRNILTFVLALFALSGMAQKLPDWIINKPSPTNNTYLYVVESATGQTEQIARNRAIAEVFRSTAMRIGQPFNSEEINSALQRGTEYYVISSQYNIPINKVCEYTDNKTSPCRVYVLCQVAKAGNIHVEFDDFNACYEGTNKVYADEAMYADGFTVSQNGVVLTDHQVRTKFANSMSYDLYDKGMVWSSQRGLLAAEISLLICGVIWVAVAPTEPDMEVLGKVGIGCLAAGSACLLVHGIGKASGKAKIRKAVNLYNNGKMYSQNDMEMEYGLTGNGVYLTFSF